MGILGPANGGASRGGEVGGAVSSYSTSSSIQLKNSSSLSSSVFKHIDCIEKFGNRKAEKFPLTVAIFHHEAWLPLCAP